MAVSLDQIRRSLLVAFSADELRTLEATPEFARALKDCNATADAIGELVKLGGALLSERRRTHSNLLKRECG